MSAGRERWGSRAGPVLASAGAAIGFGTFLRFPLQVAQHGGAAFLIPYLLALVLLGIPLMWVEWSLGRFGGARGHGTTPGILDAVWRSRVARYFGALGVLIPFVVTVYLVWVESWALGLSVLSLAGAPPLPVDVAGMDPVLRAYQGAGPSVFFLVTLVANLWVLKHGIRGIESTVRIALPALLLLALVLLGRVLMHSDPARPDVSILAGLGTVWDPDFAALADSRTWLAAASQVLFTLFLGMGSILCYASYLSEKDDVALSGLAVVATNEAAEVVVGGTILGAAGLAGLVGGGALHLGFVVLPAFFQQPPLGPLFGAAWFLLLFLAGWTTTLATGWVVIAFLEDELDLGRTRALASLGLAVLVCALPAMLAGGRGYIAELDVWAGTLGPLLLGAVELILFAWVFGMDRGWAEIVRGSRIRPHRAFRFLLKWIAPPFGLATLVGWSWLHIPDVLLLRGIDPADRPVVLGARLLLLLLFSATLALIHRAWRRRAAPR
jgi:NSS family neurotransmitter:Na+ symporter